MSVLSEDLIKAFVKETNDTKEEKKESFMYGTVHIADNYMDVLLDGAQTSTPCTTTVAVENGDRVVVMFKDRQAVITANITNPTINVDTLKAKDIEFSGTLVGADGSFAGTVTVDWQPTGRYAHIVKLGSDDTVPLLVCLADQSTDDSRTYQTAWEVYSGKDGDQEHTSISAEHGLQTTKIRTTQLNIGIDSGYIQGAQVNSNSYKDFSVDFEAYVYKTPPYVVACLNTSSTAAAYGSCSVSVHSITKTGFKVRVYNNASISLAPPICWIAVGGSD